MTLFDTHAHLDDEQFDEIRDAVVGRANEAGVETMIAVGTSASTSQKCIQIADTYESVFAAVGIQPNYCSQVTDEEWETVSQLAQHPRAVAIGETGLDRHWDYTPFAVQQKYFDLHAELSRSTGLPMVIHMRDCESDIVDSLRKYHQEGPLAAVMHSFTGCWETAEACLEMGLYISFAGMLTFKKSAELRQVAAKVPRDRLLIETDSPYLSPHPKRGQRPNEPGLIVHTAQCLADILAIDLEALGQLTTHNAKQLFSRV